MNTPQEIQALIAYAEEQYQAQMEAKKQERILAQQAEIQSRKEKAHELYQEALPLIPDVVRPFVKLDDVDISNNEYDIRWYELGLEIHVPGLAPFLMVFSKTDQGLKISRWLISAVRETDWDENFDLCKTVVFSWRSTLRFEGDKLLYEILREAKYAADELPRRQAELDQRWGQAGKRVVEREQHYEKQKSEERALFKSLQGDPVALLLLKAFVLIQDEREGFRQIIAGYEA